MLSALSNNVDHTYSHIMCITWVIMHSLILEQYLFVIYKYFCKPRGPNCGPRGAAISERYFSPFYIAVILHLKKWNYYL